MQCIICKRGPAWGMRLQAIGGDAMSCNDDLPEAVNRMVRVVGVKGIAWPFRQYIRRELRAVAC